MIQVPREVLQTALDALNESVDLVEHMYATDWRHGLPTRAQQLEGMRQQMEAHKASISALQAILDAPKVERPPCARCGAELMSSMTTTCYQCNQD